MKLLFVHDGTLKYDHDGRYYGTAVTPYSLSRYKLLIGRYNNCDSGLSF